MAHACLRSIHLDWWAGLLPGTQLIPLVCCCGYRRGKSATSATPPPLPHVSAASKPIDRSTTTERQTACPPVALALPGPAPPIEPATRRLPTGGRRAFAPSHRMISSFWRHSVARTKPRETSLPLSSWSVWRQAMRRRSSGPEDGSMTGPNGRPTGVSLAGRTDGRTRLCVLHIHWSAWNALPFLIATVHVCSASIFYRSPLYKHEMFRSEVMPSVGPTVHLDLYPLPSLTAHRCNRTELEPSSIDTHAGLPADKTI